MNTFKNALFKKIAESNSNNFGKENYDEFRFGKYDEFKFGKFSEDLSLYKRVTYLLKKAVKRIIGYKPKLINYHDFNFEKYESRLQKIYENLNIQGQSLIVELIAFRLLGFEKIKLSRNNAQYVAALENARIMADLDDNFDPHYMQIVLNKFDLNKIGKDIKLYFSVNGIAIDFILEQYAYKIDNKVIVGVEKGDVVIDAGACWGDTALYFAHKTGETGKVYSFDFIPGNMKLFNINTSFNPNLEKIIRLVPHPLSDKTGDVIYFKDNGPASRVEFKPFQEQTDTTTTLTIDDFVTQNNLDKVDFIKMDIESAEPAALRGAIETIKKFRPKLAIASYHGIDDFVNIPNWILDLGLDYEIFIDHFTIHAEETVCFAKPKMK